MKADKGPMLVLAEVLDKQKVTSSFYETLHAVQKIAKVYGSKVQVIVFGYNVADIAENIRHFDVDTVHLVDNPHLETYHPEYYLAAFRQAYDLIKPMAIFMGHTLQAIDLAPRIAFDVDASLITDCTGFNIDEEEIQFIKPVLSSHILAGYTTSPPFIITMRSKSFEPAQRLESKQGNIVQLQPNLDQLKVKIHSNIRVLHEHEGIKVEDAEIIVAGGRGIGSAEGFEKLAQLAETLGAAVGASRPPIDMGWVSAETQVGQTGAIVAPAVYFAIGISGSIQHLAGMAQSKKIVAVNKDKEATIFKYADYGAVGTYEEILPALTQAIQENKKA